MKLLEALQQLANDLVISAPSPERGNVTRVQPPDIEAAGKVVAYANENGLRLMTAGAGTKRHWLDAAAGEVIELDLRRCNRVLEYSPEDMTVTVEAGIPLAELSRVLAGRNQRLTLDPPHGEAATIGGVLAANDSGPVRLAYGTARDIVIGMSFFEPDGGLTKSGGKVVKNVAGYDIHKLFIGSFGTLGPIATVTFKLRPLPEARGLVVIAPRDAAHAEEIVAGLLSGPTRPTMIELLGSRMAEELDLGRRLTLIVGFEENADAVNWQCATVQQTFGGTVLPTDKGEQLYASLREASDSASATIFKATMLSSHVADFVSRFDEQAIRLIARAGNGIVYGVLDGAFDERVWGAIREATQAGQGSLHVRGPLPAGVARFSPPREDAFLSDGIRAAFDPKGTFQAVQVG
jgi:glycolate oxidase FAD binding subunit